MTAQAEVETEATAVTTTRLWPRVGAMAVWLLVVGFWWGKAGIPNDSLTLMLTFWLGTIAWNVEAPPRQHLAYLRDWAMPAILLTFYFYSRGFTDELQIPVHWTMPIDVDRWIGFGTTPTERLQEAWCGDPCSGSSAPRWYDAYFTSIYATHFVVGIALAAVLWVRNRETWKMWMRRYIGLNLGGLVIYIAYPMAPPWLASDTGYLGPVERLTSRGWQDIGLHRANVILDGVGNPVAAMPSLHFGTALLVAMFAIARLRSPWRWLLLAYPASMGVALVYFGEHYIIDEIAGGLLAVAVMAAAAAWERRHPSPSTPDAEATAVDVVS